MNIIVIGRSFPESKTGMMGIFEFEQARMFNDYGHEVSYVFCDCQSIKRQRKLGNMSRKDGKINIIGSFIPIGGLPKEIFNSIKYYCFISNLKKALDNAKNVDLIYIHYPLIVLNHQIWDFIRSLRIPVIVMEHWSKVQLKRLDKREVSLLKLVVEESNAFMCVGELLKESVVQLTNTKNVIHVIPNMLSPLFYYHPKSNPNKTFSYVSMGRLTKVKRFDFMIAAFIAAFPDTNDVVLNIAGDGPEYRNLKSLIKKTDMENRINLLGLLSREEIAKLVTNSDAFISTSEIETFGVPFIESMASGKPVIGVKGGSIDRYINEDNGILYEGGDIEGLIDSIRFIYDNKEKYNAKAISNYAQANFGKESVYKMLLAIMNDVVGFSQININENQF